MMLITQDKKDLNILYIESVLSEIIIIKELPLVMNVTDSSSDNALRLLCSKSSLRCSMLHVG